MFGSHMRMNRGKNKEMKHAETRVQRSREGKEKKTSVRSENAHLE